MENFENNPIQPEDTFESAQPVQPAPQEPVFQKPAPQEVVPQEPVMQEPAPQQPVTPPPVYRPVSSAPYSGAGVGRKESPFADSPYVMKHEQPRTVPQNHYQCGSTYVPPMPQHPPVKPKKQRKPLGKGWKTALCVILALAVVAGSCGITAALINNRWETEVDYLLRDMTEMNVQIGKMQVQIDAAAAVANEAANNAFSGSLAGGEGLLPSQVYAMNYRSVVVITCDITTTNAYGQSSKGRSGGSGFILSENGYVVTNAHVVADGENIVVATADGENFSAKVVGSDTHNDVALLKVEAEGLQAVKIGSSDDLLVGDQVVAIGNALGELTSTMTVGYVSGKDRDVNTDGKMINMIQTDAAINSGNSGGPLFNMRGEVVGITTAKYSGNSASGANIESIGFAIPIDDVIGMLNDLKVYGYVTGAYLGVLVSDMDASAAAYYRLPMGAYVQEVTAGYSAQRAGMQAGDIIVALGQYQVGGVSDLTRVLRKFKAGDTTTITVFRSGAEVVLNITLDEKPASTATTPSATPEQGKMPESGSYEEWYDYFFGDQG